MNELMLFGEISSEFTVIEKNGYFVLKFSICVEHTPNEKMLKKYFYLTSFNEVAKEINKQFSKGDRVLLKGYIDKSVYKNKEEKVVSSIDIIVKTLEKL